jgi:Mg-chelatase subunit ChlD
MVFALDQFEADKSFSIVQFSTSAQLASGLSSANETMEALDNAQYTGGSTDHADAIRTCQSTFSTSDPNRQNFIMLITDGLPSTTYLYPEIVATEEAEYAKDAGTFIIPIFISENYDAYAESFMTSLSSDGQVFDVAGFESLDTLKDSLVEQVSCS